MRHEDLTPVGTVVEGVDVGPLSEREVSAVRALLAEHGVAVFRDQHIDDDGFVAFLRSFGALVFTEGETPVDRYPDLNVVSNVGRSTPPKSTFHVDTTYVRRPPVYTALRAVQVPSSGGATLFSNQYAAYAALPREDRSFVDNRTITHRVTGLEGIDGSARHPVVLRHPVSHRKALYLSAPARCVAVSGMNDVDGAEFVRYLFEHSTDEANVYRHIWSPGDVVMWDNRCVMHKADHSGVVGDRVMHRGMVAG